MENKTIITSPEFDYIWEELSKKLDIPKANVKMETFPDWTPNLYIETSKALKQMWAKRIEAFATHWVFPNDSHKKISKNLDWLLTTDSIPKNIARAKDTDNMNILTTKNLIEKIISNSL